MVKLHELRMLGFGRRPGDWATTDYVPKGQWIWMEVYSDLLLVFVGIPSMAGFYGWNYIRFMNLFTLLQSKSGSKSHTWKIYGGTDKVKVNAWAIRLGFRFNLDVYLVGNCWWYDPGRFPLREIVEVSDSVTTWYKGDVPPGPKVQLVTSTAAEFSIYNLQSVKFQFMESSDGGGEQGALAKMAARPKPLDDPGVGSLLGKSAGELAVENPKRLDLILADRNAMGGGPWIHRGDALLVGEFDGITSPSRVPLEVVPIWVRIYDLPLVLMTKARGELYGSKLGRVREIDVEEDGRNKHDSFRIRVELSVKRPLRSKLAIKINVQGNEVVRRFDLRYERVPHFCLICGFIGHSDKDCERKVVAGDHPFQFSADLRCSPLKPFERKISKVAPMQARGAARKLVFRGAGSANSSSSRHRQGEQWDEAIPQRVDAHDNFEVNEKDGDGKIDQQLADEISNVQVSVQKRDEMQAGLTGGRKDDAAAPQNPQDVMIPAMVNLNQPASFGDTSMEDTGSQHKRTLDQPGIKQQGRVQQALLEYNRQTEEHKQLQVAPGSTVRALKRFRKDAGRGGR
ncbi:hypothetical protein OsJ_33563 [Oryza sativa Japonica Group]|uniref:Zinc knuckle CX2CX4HX4C domain-containing protein n=1 Tax=Oryza sativa subsp. japonica TaxID=39947 RepID=B9GA81_ORYSJ|nr:hypothetical protein OsJ_33563 [Oryza sativa Japonica Group]